MADLKLHIPPKLIPVFTGTAMYRGSYGGRGSGKTRTFAKMIAVRGRMFAEEGKEGLLVGAREYMNSLDESSMSEIKAAIRSEPWLSEFYDIGEKYIRTHDRRISFDFTGLDRNLDSIKSKSRILILWADEAEPISDEAWEKTDPTVREEGSEIWVTWNPESRRSATHIRFRENPPPHSKIVELNWRDNPWFPKELETKRLHSQETDPENYEHIWEGGFKTVKTGAYWAREILAAKTAGRIGRVSPDPLMTYRAYWDIGGTGKKADATAIWICQFVGREIRVLNYYEARHQPLSVHVQWLRDSGYAKALCVLPHDGVNGDKVYDASFQSALQQAGFPVEVVENQGPGAASLRVEAARRLFPSMWFNAETTVGGVEAISNYHEKQDEKRGIGLGPNHDWSSHGADAFGLMCIHYEAPQEKRKARNRESGGGSWMG
jgi:phage terminase large subunit